MTNRSVSLATHEDIISYQKLRTFIGFTGILLPILVVAGCFITGAKGASFQISISHFYYSRMHIVFVGVLCVLGGFLITYRGKRAAESTLSNIAGCCAFGIASFPTTVGDFRPQPGSPNQYVSLFREVSNGWGTVHFIFAFALFTCFIIFCLKYFQQPDESYTGEAERKFKKRKVIYKFCGWTIIVSILLIAAFNFIFKPEKGLFIYSTFIFETTSLWAFGFAWLVKGSAVWSDVSGVKKVVKAIR
ncbi:MAG: hypothetical protein QM764_09120 [Chitinophagaceae bacterium]